MNAEYGVAKGNGAPVQPTILIASEDVRVLAISERLLRAGGLTVRTASDGIEAREIAGSERLAVVLLDLDLPGMNGLDFIRFLSSRFEGIPRHSSLRIVVVTSIRRPERDRFALRLGASVVLRKPVPPYQLADSLLPPAPPASEGQTSRGVDLQREPTQTVISASPGIRGARWLSSLREA